MRYSLDSIRFFAIITAAAVLASASPAVAQLPEALPAAGMFGSIDHTVEKLNDLLGDLVAVMADVLFADFGVGFPLIVVILLGGGVYYSFYFGWLSLRGFRHSIDILRGKFDDPDDPGEISHFQALSSALSATIGLGNIAGVAVAVGIGGPGAIFWMMATALVGMSSKLAECTLAIAYRQIHPDGRVSGGPMYYLEEGLGERGLKPLGRTLAVLFAILAIGGSFGGGNMFQANQTMEILSTVWPAVSEMSWLVGLVLATMVAVVIIGGIRRIGRVTSRLVPFMCILYVTAAIFIILYNIRNVPDMILVIFNEAFTGGAIYGGMVGIMVNGIKRASFSNEAGIGSAAFAHAAAKTNEPAREGMVAMIGPFIDTICICLMTGLVCMITGVYNDPEFKGQGVAMTAAAFESFIPGASYVLAFVVVLFAYSTMISWSYYGERAWEYLFGERAIIVYRVLFVGFVFVGSVAALGNVIDFSDMMILGMAFPNIIGGILLSPKVKGILNDYWQRYTSGEMKAYR